MKKNNETSYKQILKSTAIIGGSSVIDIIFRIIRTKAVALLLGPTGVGIMGIYVSILGTANTISGCGLSASGARQIAEAHSTSDPQKILTASTAVLRLGNTFAVMGAIALFLLSGQISLRTFGDNSHRMEIAILSLGVLLSTMGNARGAFLQGFRRIGDLARVSVLGAVTGATVMVLLVFFLKEMGVAIALVSASMVTFFASSYYSNKVVKNDGKTQPAQMKKQLSMLLKIGVAFMLAGFLSEGTQYFIRVLINREMGLEATGYFTAAWSISMLYIGFVLGAMGTDFYPRLSALSGDHAAMGQLVNEQIEVALLLAGPIVLGMLTFAPIVTFLLYSEEFASSNQILRWQVLGTLFKVASWPLGFIILAKGYSLLFFITELSWYVTYLTIIYLTIGRVGLVSTGISFTFAYVIYLFVVYLVAVNLIRFSPSFRIVVNTVFLAISMFLVLFLSYFTTYMSYITGSTLTILLAIYSVYALKRLSGHPELTQLTQRLRSKLFRR